MAGVGCGPAPSNTGEASLVGSAETEDVLAHAAWTKNATIYEVNVFMRAKTISSIKPIF